MTRYGIVGVGRVGSAIAGGLLARGHEVYAVDLPGRPVAPGTATTLTGMDTCDVVVECLPEVRSTKVDVLHRLGGSAPVLTTTSSFTVAELADASGLGDRLAGFHHLASYQAGLVELVREHSGPAARAAAADLAAALDLATIDVADRPGRISRRLLVPFVQNALAAVDLEIASPEDVDRVVELGLGHAVGPLQRLAAAGVEDHRATVGLLRAPAAPARD